MAMVWRGRAWRSRHLTLQCGTEIPPGAPAGLTFPVVCSDPNDPASKLESATTVPLGQTWLVREVFIRAAGDAAVDGQVVFRKVGGREVFRTNPLSALVITNPAFPGLKSLRTAIEYRGGELWNLVYYTLSPNTGTAAASVTFFIELDVFEYA